MYFHPRSLSLSPRLAICANVYMMPEWMGREKCKWESCVGWFAFFTVRRMSYIHINFPTPYSADSALLLLLFRTFMSTLTYHPFCFLSMRTCWCWWVVEKGKTFLSILFKRVWVRATLNWACRKYNQFYFVRTHPTLAHISAALKHLVDPHRASRENTENFSDIFLKWNSVMFRPWGMFTAAPSKN